VAEKLLELFHLASQGYIHALFMHSCPISLFIVYKFQLVRHARPHVRDFALDLPNRPIELAGDHLLFIAGK
jgi:hypothetical protein